MTAELGLVLPPATLASGRCALCWASFRLGDSYTTLWRRGGLLALHAHPGCLRELEPGDVTTLFGALERRFTRVNPR